MKCRDNFKHKTSFLSGWRMLRAVDNGRESFIVFQLNDAVQESQC